MPRHVAGAARQRSVDAAARLFHARGYAGVSVDDVARAAGVSKVTVYAHFPGKDALAAAALRSQGEQVLALLLAAVEGAGDDPRRRVEAVFDAYAAQMGGTHVRGCPFLNAAAEAPDPAHPVHAEVHRYKGQVGALLRDAAAAAGHPEPEVAAEELQLLLDGALVQSGTSGTPRPLATARRLAGLVLGPP